jgi:hypothetical protein
MISNKRSMNVPPVYAGEPVTHRCPRCKALVHEGCLLEELKGPWAMIVKEAAPQMFLRAVDPSIPGMQGRMLIDEAFSCVVDWMQCKASMCCLGCVLDLRCCQARFMHQQSLRFVHSRSLPLSTRGGLLWHVLFSVLFHLCLPNSAGFANPFPGLANMR